jgi:hypothetical protein
MPQTVLRLGRWLVYWRLGFEQGNHLEERKESFSPLTSIILVRFRESGIAAKISVGDVVLRGFPKSRQPNIYKNLKP